MDEAEVVRRHIHQSLFTTVACNGVAGVSWAVLLVAMTMGTGISRGEMGQFFILLIGIRILPPYLLAAIGLASVKRADNLAVATVVLAPLAGWLASLMGWRVTPALPLLELPLHLLTVVTAISVARKIRTTPFEQLAAEAETIEQT